VPKNNHVLSFTQAETSRGTSFICGRCLRWKGCDIDPNERNE